MSKCQLRDSGAPKGTRRRAREGERDKFGQNPGASPTEGGTRRGGKRGGGAGPRGNRLAPELPAPPAARPRRSCDLPLLTPLNAEQAPPPPEENNCLVSSPKLCGDIILG